MPEFYGELETSLLFGPDVRAEDLNDDALARALDKLAAAGPARVYMTVAARALARMQVPWQELLSSHVDTTSVSVQGAYRTDDELLRRGYSRDHQPDLKQFMLAVCHTKHGLPIGALVRPGNESDKQTHGEWLHRLQEALPPERLQQMLQVADSALVTKANLERIAQLGLRFISRLPSTFGVAETIKAAVETGPWTEVGALSSRPGAAHYGYQEHQAKVDGRSYRVIAVRSDHLDERQAKVIQRQVADERAHLERILRELTSQDFACEADARAAEARLFERHEPTFWRVTLTLETLTRSLPHPSRGRPPQGGVRLTDTVYRYRADLALESSAVDLARLRASTFLLLTNDPGLAPIDILREYKDQQSAVEIPFHIIKSLPVSPVFFKRPERVKAFAWVWS